MERVLVQEMRRVLVQGMERALMEAVEVILFPVANRQRLQKQSRHNSARKTRTVLVYEPREFVDARTHQTRGEHFRLLHKLQTFALGF